MRNKYLLFLFIAIIGSSCNLSTKQTPTANTPVPVQNRASAETGEAHADPVEADARSAVKVLGTAAARELCYETDTGDNVVLKSQTFALEFEPYKGSCFVTSHNPEFDDPPMESEFAIFKNGKKLADFPTPFNGATFGCWVDGVAFQDLNADGLVDIIVAGKCSAKSSVYNENSVYVNTRKGFTTNEDGNIRISEFTKIKEIVDFVKENKQIYFK